MWAGNLLTRLRRRESAAVTRLEGTTGGEGVLNELTKAGRRRWNILCQGEIVNPRETYD